MIRFVPKDRVDEVKNGKPQKGDEGQAKKTIARDQATGTHVSVRTQYHQARRGKPTKGAPDKGPGSGITKEMKPYAKKMLAKKSMKESLKGGQGKLDVNKNGKLDSADFKMLRAGKKKKVNASTELDRIGITLMEGLVKAKNKAMKKSWEEGEGKKKWVAKKGGETERERNAARMGGKGGGVEALQKGVKASYRATHRENVILDQLTSKMVESFDGMLTELESKTLQSYHQKRAAQLRMMPGTNKPRDFKKGWKGIKKAEEKLKKEGAKVPEIPTRKDAGTPKPKKGDK
jgi:hypothetical protein